MPNLFNGARALFLAPHTDDVELGCGATLARCVEECERVDVAVFSTAVESLPEGSAPDRLKEEFLTAMEHYSIPRECLHIFDYKVRKLNYARQEVLEDLVRIAREISPNLIFTPSGRDVHQDHQVVHNETLRAFKSKTILGYELPWNHFNFEPRVLVNVSKHHMQQKKNALSAYTSQVEKGRPYFDDDFINGLAKVRGVQLGSDFAEAFELVTLKV